MALAQDDWQATFKALSDVTRLKILGLLSSTEVCACDILEEVNITQPTLSYHMKMLCGCGLVEGRKDSSWMRYKLNIDRISQIQNFLEVMKDSPTALKTSSC